MFDYTEEFQKTYSPRPDVSRFLGDCLRLAVQMTGCEEAFVVFREEDQAESQRIALKRRRGGSNASVKKEGCDGALLNQALRSFDGSGQDVAWFEDLRAGCKGACVAAPVHYGDQLRGALLVCRPDGLPQSGKTGELLTRLAADISFHCQRHRVRRLVAEKLERNAIMIGASDALRQIDCFVEKTANADLTVLITGEVGSGKELAAYGVHFGSPRRTGPLVVVNCAALPRDLAESMLFGHAKGAFTGATAHYSGYFEQAEGGTIFLDEIGELDLAIQAKLLRTIQFGELHGIGGEGAAKRIDVRVIAATNSDLGEEVKKGRFSAALYARLNVLHLKVPPLRSRLEDIPPLVQHFVANYGGDQRREVAPEVVRAFQGHDWPSNVRELENVIARLVTFSDNAVIQLEDLHAFVPNILVPRNGSANGTRAASGNLRRLVEDFEKSHIEAALRRRAWNVTRTARDLGTSHQNLFKKIKKYGFERPRPAFQG